MPSWIGTCSSSAAEGHERIGNNYAKVSDPHRTGDHADTVGGCRNPLATEVFAEQHMLAFHLSFV